MHALLKSVLGSLLVVLLMRPFDTEAMTETAVIHSGQLAHQTLMFNTLLLGAIIPFFGESRLDPEYFQNKAPEPKEFDEREHESIEFSEEEPAFDEEEPFWQWLLNKHLKNPNLSEDDIAAMVIRRHLEEAGIEVDEIYREVRRNQTSTTSFIAGQPYTVPGIYNYGGGDGNQGGKASSDQNKTNEKESQNEATKQDEKKSDDGDDKSGSSVSTETATTSSVQVMDGSLRPIVTLALENYKKQDGCFEELEGGGYSRTYIVADADIKLVFKEPCMPPRDEFPTEEKYKKERQRLLNMSQNEKDMLLQLKHKNIVELIAYVEIELPQIGKAFLLVMEYAGQDLRYFLKHKYRAIKKQILSIARDVADGVNYLHSKGVIWGDLKSDNVMVRIHGQQLRVRLIDMATCQSPAERASLMLDHIHTQGWQAPELHPYVEGVAVTQAADIYGFGLVCAMLQGIHRNAGVKDAFKHNRRKEPAKVNPLILSIVIEPIKHLCGFSDDRSACSAMPNDLAIQRIKTDETFLLVLAVLTTRAPEHRPSMEAIKRYIEAFQYRPDQ